MDQPTPDHPSCKFCGSTELHKSSGDSVYYGIAYSVFYCPHCAIGMTWPQPDVATLERFYAPGEYRAEEGKRFIAPVEWLFELHKKLQFTRLSGGLSAGNMLDIGCGSGYTASLFARNGWSVTGVEFSEETAGHARDTYGIPVVTSVSQLQGRYDLILVNHVLEHYYDPARLLQECSRLLSPTGRLVVAVPNFSSFQSRIGQKSWFHRDLPIHLFHFAEDGLAGLLVRSGYTIIGRSHADWAQNFYGWLQTLLNCANLQYNSLYDFLRMRNKGSGGMSSSVLFSLLLSVLAVPASLFGMFVERVFRTGGVICFTAVRNQASLSQEDIYRAE
jgi:SAM-dependent methyltransferase